MADPQHRQDITTRHPFHQGQGDGGPSKSKILAVVTVFLVGGFLLLLLGMSMTLAGTLIGLALTFPLFLICSPVLVPAALALAVAGFLTSGAFGITALSSLSWIVNYMRKSGWPMGQMEHGKPHVQIGL